MPLLHQAVARAGQKVPHVEALQRFQVRQFAASLAEATGRRLEPAASPDDPIPHGCELILLDGSGGIRGSYRDDTNGLDEIFHRSQHVLRAMGALVE